MLRLFTSWWYWLAALLASGPLAGRAQAPDFGPAVVVGTGTAGTSFASCTVVDSQGYVYVAGSYTGTVQLGSTILTTSAPSSNLSGGYVAKLDGAGKFQWVRQVSGAGSCYAGRLALAPGGQLLLTGTFYGPTVTLGTLTLAGTPTAFSSSDGFVASLDTDGNWQWATSAGGSGSDAITRVVTDGAGSVYVCGGFASTTLQAGALSVSNSSSINLDTFVGKLDGQGNWQWLRSAGGGNQDVPADLGLDAGGNLYLAASVQGTATFGPFVTSSPTQTGNADIVVAKLTSGGTWQWLARAGGIGIDEPTGLAVDAAGNCFVAGRFDGPICPVGSTTLLNANANGPSAGYRDVLVARLGAAGTWQWAVRAGGTSADAGGPVALDAAGRLVVAGTFSGTDAQFGATTLAAGSAGYGMFYSYLDPATGAWQGITTSQGGAEPACLTPDLGGNVSLSGSFTGSSLSLGSSTLTGRPTDPSGFVTLVPMVPAVTNLAPTTAAPGQPVVVQGTGFAGVTQVLFGGVAATFTVQSANQLTATVPVGAPAGPVRVYTSRGNSMSAQVFQPQVLAAWAEAAPAAAPPYPNPAHSAEPWQVARPTDWPTAPVQAEVRDALGRLVFAVVLDGRGPIQVPVPALAPGVYQLALTTTGRPAYRHRVVVAN